MVPCLVAGLRADPWLAAAAVTLCATGLADFGLRITAVAPRRRVARRRVSCQPRDNRGQWHVQTTDVAIRKRRARDSPYVLVRQPCGTSATPLLACLQSDGVDFAKRRSGALGVGEPRTALSSGDTAVLCCCTGSLRPADLVR